MSNPTQDALDRAQFLRSSHLQSTWGEEDPMNSVADKIWYMAECQQCTPIHPRPYQNVVERDAWVRDHGLAAASPGHEVKTWFETRHMDDVQLASQFLRNQGMDPTPDAIDQFYNVFMPCLRIMCERGYNPAGATWQQSGWRGALWMMRHKMARLWEKSWQRGQFNEDDARDLINYAGFYLRARRDRAWGEWGPPGGDQQVFSDGLMPGEKIVKVGPAKAYKAPAPVAAKNGPPFTDDAKRAVRGKP